MESTEKKTEEKKLRIKNGKNPKDIRKAEKNDFFF